MDYRIIIKRTPSGLLFLCLLFIGGLYLINLLKVPAINEQNARLVSGTLKEAYESGVKDITLVLDSGEAFYINRVLEQGLSLADFQSLIDNEITIYYPDFRLGGIMQSKHISAVMLSDSIVYAEPSFFLRELD